MEINAQGNNIIALRQACTAYGSFSRWRLGNVFI